MRSGVIHLLDAAVLATENAAKRDAPLTSTELATMALAQHVSDHADKLQKRPADAVRDGVARRTRWARLRMRMRMRMRLAAPVAPRSIGGRIRSKSHSRRLNPPAENSRTTFLLPSRPPPPRFYMGVLLLASRPLRCCFRQVRASARIAGLSM